MIRILHILWSAHFGGIERLVFDLSSAQMADPSMTVTIMFGRLSGEFLERFVKAGIPQFSANLRSGFDVSPWKFRKIVGIFRGFDILHIHSFNPVLCLAAVVSGRKIVYTEHGNFGFGRKQSFADLIKYKLLKCFLNKQINYLSFNSLFTRKIAQERYGLENVKQGVLYNGINFNNYGEDFNGSENIFFRKIEGSFIIGTSSRFAGFKRVDRLIRAFAGFQKGKKTILLLVGDGILRNDLEILGEQLAVSHKIIFTGFQENVREFQNLMDVCVFPSVNEPFGLVAVETLSLGKPTIVFKDGGGIVEVAGGFSQDDVVTDIPDLIKRLEYYYENKEEIINKLDQRKEYSKKFDINMMASEFIMIYKQVLKCAA